MTYGEARKILQERHGWLPWRKFSSSRLVILTCLGLTLGFFAGTILDGLHNRPAVKTNSLSAVIYKGYVTLIVDRTRVNWCDVQPTRVAFRNDSFGGEVLPFILPLSSQSLVWPFLGRQRFGLMVMRVKDLSPGVWTILTTQRAMCHWYDYLIGPRITTSEATLNVPALPGEGQVR